MNRNINKIAKKVVTVLVVIILLGGGIGLVALMGIIDSDSGQENIGAEKIGGDLCYALRIPALGYEEFNQVPLAQQPSLQLPPDWSVVGFTATQPPFTSAINLMTLVCSSPTVSPHNHDRPTVDWSKIGGDLCYALRIPTVTYEDFSQGKAQPDQSLPLPPGWSSVGFTASQQDFTSGIITLVCGPDPRSTRKAN